MAVACWAVRLRGWGFVLVEMPDDFADRPALAPALRRFKTTPSRLHQSHSIFYWAVAKKIAPTMVHKMLPKQVKTAQPPATNCALISLAKNS